MSAVATSDADLVERLIAGATGTTPRAERGRAWLAANGLPTERDEAWRYTPVRDITAALATAVAAGTEATGVTRDLVDELAGDLGGPRLVLINGALAPELSDLTDRGAGLAGLWVGGGDELRARGSGGPYTGTAEPADGFQALNWVAGVDAAVVLIEAGNAIDAPIHVVHLATPGQMVALSHPRTVIKVGAGGRAQVVESFVGIDATADGRAITNSSTRIVVDDDAELTYQRVLNEPDTTLHIGRVGVVQRTRSQLHATAVATGGAVVRTAVHVNLTGERARADLGGLYLPTGHQRHDNVITVDHSASYCESNQNFTGIVGDHGRGSFSGHVIVRPGTVGTDANQSNPNLVLASTAQADTRPWLEIFADDVKCAHGATVGRLDEEAAFYLRSRGIPAAQARAMLVAAFASTALDRLSPDTLRERVASVVEVRTADTTANLETPS